MHAVSPYNDGITAGMAGISTHELDPRSFDLLYPLDSHKELYLKGFEDSGYYIGVLVMSAAAGDAGRILNSQTAHKICFIAGTEILAEDGHIAIETVRIGDKVYSENPETGENGLKRVVQTFVNETDRLVKVFVDGQEITTTPVHPFYVPDKGWVDAGHLRSGDKLILQTGEIVVVEQVRHELLEVPVTVYNFEVEDWHTYYVSESSVLVHNDCAYKQKIQVKGKQKTDIPDRFKGEKPFAGESGKKAAERVLKNYSEYDPKRTGPGTDFNKLKKYFDTHFE